MQDSKSMDSLIGGALSDEVPFESHILLDKEQTVVKNIQQINRELIGIKKEEIEDSEVRVV